MRIKEYYRHYTSNLKNVDDMGKLLQNITEFLLEKKKKTVVNPTTTKENELLFN